MGIKIGELARISGCKVVTIRYYEKEGLLPQPQRTSGNYRLYSDSDLNRLRFILHCRRHGINLAEIRQLLVLRDKPEGKCSFAHELIRKQLQRVDAQIASLNALRSELLELSQIHCDNQGHCAILDKLNAADGCSCCENINCLNKKGRIGAP